MITEKQLKDLRSAAHELRAALASSSEGRDLIHDPKNKYHERIKTAWFALGVQLEKTN